MFRVFAHIVELFMNFTVEKAGERASEREGDSKDFKYFRPYYYYHISLAVLPKQSERVSEGERDEGKIKYFSFTRAHSS
jgi:hypothetical protein